MKNFITINLRQSIRLFKHICGRFFNTESLFIRGIRGEFYYIFLRSILFFWCICLFTPLYGQEEEDEDKSENSLKLHHTAELGFSIGGQVSNDNFVLETGKLFQYTADLQASTRVYYGIGAGIEKFDSETFIPVFASFKGLLKKKDSTPYLTAQMGYAFASNSSLYSYDGYSYRGGILFSPGFGYKLSVKDKYSILFSVNYKHQFAKLNYETYDLHKYQDNLNFDLISFRVGILL